MRIKELFQFVSPDWSADWAPGKRSASLVQLICAALLAPLLYICMYVHPSGRDDYANADWTSFPRGFAHIYQTSGGRYFSNIAAMLSPLHWHSMSGYRIACAILLAAFIVTFYRLLSAGFRTFTTVPRYVGRAIAAVSVVLMLNNMAALSEGFFWYTGAVTYVLSAMLLGWFCLILLRKTIDTIHRAALLILCFAIVGGNELTMLLCTVLSVGGWLFSKTANRDARKKMYAFLSLECLVCAAISVMAPGNYVRLGQQERPLSMVLPDWLYFTQKFAYNWITSPYLLLFSLMLVIVTQAYPLRKPFLSLLSAFLLPVGIMYLLTLPVTLSLGSKYHPRVQNVIYVFFLIGWIVFVLHLSYWIRLLVVKAGESRAQMRQMLLIGGIIVVLISVNTHNLRNSNLFNTYKCLARGIPKGYSAELNSRYRLLQQNTDTLLVAPIRHKDDNVLYFLDNTPSTADEQNKSYARYWGRKAVGVIKDSTTALRPY